MFNHTIELKEGQACHFKVKRTFYDGGGGYGYVDWNAGFNFAENDGVAIIAKNYSAEESEYKFWSK